MASVWIAPAGEGRREALPGRCSASAGARAERATPALPDDARGAAAARLDRRRARGACACPTSRCSTARRPLETLAEAAERWRASRVDVTESTRVLHRVALDRVTPIARRAPRRRRHRRRRRRARRDARRSRQASARRSARASSTSRRCSTTPASTRTRPATKSDPAPARGARGAEPADRRARRGRLPAARRPRTGCRCSGSTGRARASARVDTLTRRRLRRARPPRPAARVDDEDTRGALGRAPGRARRRARGDAPAARGPRPGRAACSRASAPTGSGRRSRGRAGRPACRCSPARPPAPADQPAPSAGPLVGGDRPLRRPAEAVASPRTRTRTC